MNFIGLLKQMAGTLCILFVLSPQLAPILGVLMLSISAIVGEQTAKVSLSVLKRVGTLSQVVLPCSVKALAGQTYEVTCGDFLCPLITSLCLWYCL